MTQQSQPLADRVAAAFEHLDAQQWGYDHGFCGTYGTDPETDSFVNAALAVVQPALDERDAEIRRMHERSSRRRRAMQAAQESERVLQRQIDEQAAEIDRLRAELQQTQQQLRLIDDEIEEFDAAAQSDPNTPASVLLMIQILRRIRPAAVSGA